VSSTSTVNVTKDTLTFVKTGTTNATIDKSFTLTVPTVTVMNGTTNNTTNYYITYNWTRESSSTSLSKKASLTSTETAAGTYTYKCAITATPKLSGDVLTDTYTATVKVTAATYSVTAGVPVNGDAFAMSDTNDYTETSVVNQISSANSAM
jgi:plastocyanin